MVLWVMKRVKGIVSNKKMWSHAAKQVQISELLERSQKSPWLLQKHSFSDTSFRKPKIEPLQERKMIDRFKLRAKGGDGGNGCCSFLRSRHDRHGRPDGGNGGRGGDVILECSPDVWDFSGLQHHINAKKGGHGASKNKIGSRGADKVAHVPVGTVIHLAKGNIPMVIEQSSKDLDPWEMPGSLDLSEPDLQSLSGKKDNVVDKVACINNGLASCTNWSAVQSASMNQFKALSQSSACGNKSRGHMEQTNHWKVEGRCEWEESEIENVNSETEWEEVKEEENILYNVAELTKQGQRIVVAQGGDGGLGNLCSPKAPENQHFGNSEMQKHDDFDIEVSDDDQRSSPRTGLPGSEVVLVLELKSIADVGLVGIPNAGKSTLLGVISRAQPVVGHYAFTTLRPNLGNLNYDDFSVTVADIPGLIRGAHENRGLGHAFLRHIERTKVIAYVVDLAAALDGNKGIPPWEQLKDLILELEFYREGLSNRPCLIVANKIDEAGAEKVFEELKRRVNSVPIYPVCAVLEEGISELRAGFRMLMNEGESCRLNLDDILLD